MSKHTVMKANPYYFNCLGSLSKGEGVLLRQHEFPNDYDSSTDKFTGADHDRLFQWDYDHSRDACKNAFNTGEMYIQQFALTSSPASIMSFLKDILKADPSIEWTGFRILGTVNRSNGYPVFSLALFSNQSGCITYSNDSAPNVNQDENNVKMSIYGEYEYF